MKNLTLFPVNAAIVRAEAVIARFNRYKQAPVAAPKVEKRAAVSVAPSAPVCIVCGERPAAFGLADREGRALPSVCGGFCRECAPAQTPEIEEIDTNTTPASLETVEAYSPTLDELVREIEKHGARCAAFAKAAKDAAMLRCSIAFYDTELNDPLVFMTKIQRAKIEGLRAQKVRELEAIEAEHPFI